MSKHTITSTITNNISRNIESLLQTQGSVNFQLDYLAIKTNSIKTKNLEKYFHKKCYFINRYYSKSEVYVYKKDISIKVFQNLRNEAQSKNFTHKIELNPRHIGSYRKLKRILTLLIGKKGIQNHKVSRLDFSFRFPNKIVNVECFHTVLDVERKRVSTITHSNLSSAMAEFSIGKQPHRVTVYNQSTKLKKFEQEPFINFEIQITDIRNYKLPIKKISEIKKLLNFNPLETVHFYDISRVNYDFKNNERMIQLVTMSYCRSFKISKLKYQELYGSNFKRDILDKGIIPELSFKNCTFKSSLLQTYKCDLKAFLSS